MRQLEQLVEIREAAATGRARALRLAARLSQGEVAAELGCSRAAVSRWERGRRLPRGRVAGRYLRLLETLARVPTEVE